MTVFAGIAANLSGAYPRQAVFRMAAKTGSAEPFQVAARPPLSTPGGVLRAPFY